MKKKEKSGLRELLTILFALFVIIAFVSCSNGDNGDPKEKSDNDEIINDPDNDPDKDPDDPVVIPQLSGSVTISVNPSSLHVNSLLIANISAVTGGNGVFNFRWQRKEISSGTWSDVSNLNQANGEYIVAAGDEGYIFQVLVTRANAEGQLVGGPIGPVPIQKPIPGNNLSDRIAWLNEFAENGGVYNIVLNGDEEFSSDQLILPDDKNDIIISLSASVPSTIRLAAIERQALSLIPPSTPNSYYNDVLFNVHSGVTLIIGDNITLKGWKPTGISTLMSITSAVFVQPGGTFIMNPGSKIIDNFSYLGGGGVYINGGTFIMNGGIISNNSAHYDGGGVYVNSGGKFIMRGGIISNNISRNGGGVYVNSSSAFKMSSGIIYGSDDIEYQNVGRFRIPRCSLFVSDNSTAEYGTSDAPSQFKSLGIIPSSDFTINLVNGQLMQPLRINATYHITVTGIPFIYNTYYGSIVLDGLNSTCLYSSLDISSSSFFVDCWEEFPQEGKISKVYDITLILTEDSYIHILLDPIIKEFKHSRILTAEENVIPFSSFVEQIY